MRIGLATQRDLMDWEVDDRPFHAELAARGVDVAHPIWNDPEVDWATFDAVLIRTTWDYTDDQAAFVAWAERAERATRLFNPARVVRWNTHKGYLHQLETAGVHLAPTVWLPRGSPVDVAATVRERGWSRGFVKPMVGATARETLRFTADPAGLAEAQAFLERTLAVEDMMLQPYLPAVEEVGERSVVFFGGRPSHGVRKVPVPGDYRVQDDFGAHDEPWSPSDDELELASGVVRAAQALLGELLYARVDLLEDEQGRLVLTELELVEPSLFFRHDATAAARLADALLARL